MEKVDHRDKRRSGATPISARDQFVHVLALFGFAIAQPLYDLLGNDPTFFIYHRSGTADFFSFVGIVSLLLPAALFAIVELLGLTALGRRWPRAVVIAALAALVLLPPAARLEWAFPWLIVAAAALAGVTVAYVRERFHLWRRFLTLLAPAILIFPLIFLFRDGIRDQWLGSDERWESGGPGSGVPIVLVVFDALPTASLLDARHEIDRIRYPSFAKLADVATWYRRATAVDTFTNRAVPAILTGLCPTGGKAPIFSEFPRNLFTYTSEANRIEAVEEVTSLCPEELCAREIESLGGRLSSLFTDASIAMAHTVLPVPWREGLPPIDTGLGDFGDGALPSSGTKGLRHDARIERYESSLSRLTSGPEPPLYFAHLVQPHRPYVYLPSGRKYRLEHHKPDHVEPWAFRHNYQRHLLQLAYADALLGRLLERLESVGLFDDALIVVTADHGVSFRPNEPARDLGQTNAVDILSVPLLIKRPRQRSGETRDDLAQTVDILPTLAEVAGLELPAQLDGLPLPFGDAPVRAERSCPQVRSQPAPRMTLADLLSAADTKIELFGDGEGAGPFPAHRWHSELLQSVASTSTCSEAPSHLAYRVENSQLYEAVDPASGFTPAEIKGFLMGAQGAVGVDLAVVLNGTVAATTRSYRSGAADFYPWESIVPENALHSGKNTVSLFAIRPPQESCRLEPLGQIGDAEQPSLLEARLGAWPVPGVEENGFGRPIDIDGSIVRELKRRAVLRMPLPSGGQAPPATLRVSLEVLDEAGASVTIRIDGRRRFRGRLATGTWDEKFSLDLAPGSDSLALGLSSAGLSSAGADPRQDRAGAIALRGVWLLPEAGE